MRKQQGGQVGAVDARAHGSSDPGLGMESDAETGGCQHRRVVGAVANRYRLVQRNAVFCSQSEERLPLGFGGHHRLTYGAGNAACGEVQPVRYHMIKPQFGGDPFGEDREPTRNQCRDSAAGAHRSDQLPGSSRNSNSLRCSFEHALLHSREQRHTLCQRGGKVDLAVHRTAGDLRDLWPKPDETGELIEHLVLDDRRLHIGDEKAFAPLRQRLDDDIDWRITDCGACGLLACRRIGRIENQIARLTRRKPDRAARGPCGIGGRRGETSKPEPAMRPGDQCKNDRHRLSSYPDHWRAHKRPAVPSGRAATVIVIAGPTASGKSTLALALADALGGVIINADSMQCYRDLRILTARPDDAAERQVPHRLYGFLDAGERGSVAHWRALALAEIAAATRARRLPILVGGTGLYLRALEKGLAPIPEIPDEIRKEAVELHRQLGGAAFRERLAEFDPISARRLAPGDKQRLIRAFEVARATGVPIGHWQGQPVSQPNHRVGTILLAPPRDQLYAACDARLVRMIEAGGLDEAAKIAARGLDPDLPAMKALGLHELLSHLRGEMPLDTAIIAAQRATRRYAKRQMTWFRHQTAPDLVLTAQFSESLLRCSRYFIDRFLLTGSA